MKWNMTREQGLRWAFQGTMLVLVLVAAYAVTLYLKIDEIESSLARVRADSQAAGEAATAARTKMQEALKDADAKLAELQARQQEAGAVKALVAKIEPQIAAILEAAARTGKPESRATALTGLGLIGQVAHGANHDASLGVLVRALALDKGNCVAALGINLIGKQTVEVPAGCAEQVPGAAPAAAAKPGAQANPAAEAKPGAQTKPAADPAGAAGKPAPSAGKS